MATTTSNSISENALGPTRKVCIREEVIVVGRVAGIVFASADRGGLKFSQVGTGFYKKVSDAVKISSEQASLCLRCLRGGEKVDGKRVSELCLPKTTRLGR
jgi:hypothetical protein